MYNYERTKGIKYIRDENDRYIVSWVEVTIAIRNRHN